MTRASRLLAPALLIAVLATAGAPNRAITVTKLVFDKAGRLDRTKSDLD